MGHAPLRQSILLVTAFLVTFCAQDALAHGDHNVLCQGPHKNDEGCNGGAAPDPWHLVVEDSTGAFVGIPMDWLTPPWLSAFRVYVAIPAPDGGPAVVPEITLILDHGLTVHELHTDTFGAHSVESE